MMAIIVFYCKKRLCGQNCHREIIFVLGENEVSGSTVYNWYAEHRGVRRSFQNDPQSGHPRGGTTDEFISTVEDLTRGNPNTAIRKMSKHVNITTGRVHNIIRNILQLRRVYVIK